MTYPADYGDSHRQHWTDAELLFANSRWLNADQLYGLCAECGLKAVMRRWGMPVGPLGVPSDASHRRHVNTLWPEFATVVRGRIGGRYLNMLPPRNPFTKWSIHNRYAQHHHFSRVGVQPHRKAARDVRTMVERARQDGVL